MGNLEKGNEGEQIAIEFLEKKGYEILEKNWRAKRAELDIISKDKDMLVFVEVKTRNKFGIKSAERAINRLKRTMMIKAANAYIEQKKLDFECRFDVITIYLGSAHPEINHYKFAFYPRPK